MSFLEGQAEETRLVFTELPRGVLLGNLRGFKSIKNNTEHKNNTFASCTGSLNPVGSLNLPELGTPLLQGKPSPDLTSSPFALGSPSLLEEFFSETGLPLETV